MIDLVLAAGIGFICGSFLTVGLLALCMIAKESGKDERDSDM